MDEKIICCGDRNDMVPAWALMGNNGGFGGNMWNNPFAYLIFMMFANRMGLGGWNNGEFNGQAQQNVEVQNQLQAIRSQLQDNQNNDCVLRAITGTTSDVRQLAQQLNCDFNTLNSCCCDLKQAIATLSGQVGYGKEAIINAVLMGKSDIISALQNCCCQTQRQIADFRSDVQLQMCQQTGTLRDGQRDLGQAITQGFAQSSFEGQKQTCDIIQAGQQNTQRIIDTLNQFRSDDQSRTIQDLKNEVSQLKQTDAIVAAVMARMGNNNCCGNNCNF